WSPCQRLLRPPWKPRTLLVVVVDRAPAVVALATTPPRKSWGQNHSKNCCPHSALRQSINSPTSTIQVPMLQLLEVAISLLALLAALFLIWAVNRAWRAFLGFPGRHPR